MKKKKNFSRRNIATALVFVFVLALIFFYRVFFLEKGIVAGEENQSSLANLEEFRNKVGSAADYTIDPGTNALTFLVAKKGKTLLPFERLFSLRPEMAASYFLQEYGKYFGLTEPAKELIYVGKKSDERKMNHILYNQK